LFICCSSEKELQADYLAIYEKEKSEGTDLPAILGLVNDYCFEQWGRPHAEQQERRQRLRDEERLACEQRLLSGADCKWTQLQRSPH
jgi:hypothetical protein